jgi:hypothetical protein
LTVRAAVLLVAALAPALLTGRAPQDAKAPAPGAAKPSDDADWKKRVDVAVDRGDDFLKKRQEPDGGYGVYHFHGDRDYVAGQAALALLARIAAGENQNEASIVKGFEWLRGHPPRYTYEVGLVLMAFDARAAPIGERLALEKATPDELRKYTFPRTLEPRDRDWLQPLIDRLARERFKECWSYGGEVAPTTADMSNTQYAVLGLKAASRLGLTVDRRLFADVLDYCLDHQQPHAKPHKILVKYVDVQPAPDGTTHRYARTVEPRGFAYTYGTREGPELIASRACIDVACVVLSLDELLTKATGATRERGRARRQEADEAVDSALAWLDQNWAVDRHPPGNPGQGYYYYYLYALERAGALTSRRFVGEHDWYREGAEELLKRQVGDGSWPSGGWDNELVNTCFALLFLRRATLRASVTAGGR